MILQFESFYQKPKNIFDDGYNPTSDSYYKKLLNNPINTLSATDVRYIYGVENARYMSEVKRFDNVDDSLKDSSFDMLDFKECSNWLNSLSFPLTVYRTVWDSTDIDDICGKHHDICWTTDIDIFRNEKSKFRNATRIVRGVINNQKIINIPTTIERFLFYSGRYNEQGYGEFEINLKPNYKNSDIQDLQFIDKGNV